MESWLANEEEADWLEADAAERVELAPPATDDNAAEADVLTAEAADDRPFTDAEGSCE